MKTVSDVRSAFLEYFRGQGHIVLPSSPLVPHNDPTLMFTNAGMVQFKDIFTGKEKPLQPRAATSQKCVRAGGKHNDLDNVGYTARHHTFFEMLGNFSFGDYFKEGAILNAWDLVTKTYGLNKEKLCVTVYHTDDEAFNLWKKIAGLPDHKIIRIDTNDNFWAMGDTGPCGPCSEIFYDHGDKIPGGRPGSADADGDRFIEIWNLVFMQYEKLVDGSQISLPKPSIDTGMGLERISAILQGVHDNYDIDLFKNLIAASKQESRNSGSENSHRIIADHLRSTSFLIADGVLPSSEGRGYVLRRIMRRAMRHAHQLGCKDPLMFRLVPSLIREMGQQYPELIRAEKLITETLKTEEERFKVTLERGLKLLEGESKTLAPGAKLSGETAFKLYDTFGFPLDLTEDILRAEGKSADTKGFEAAMLEQKKKARAAWSGSGEKATDDVWFSIREEVGATEFLGYESLKASGKIVAMLREGRRVKQASEGDVINLITNQTPFYGESGGQMGDHGLLKNGDASFVVTDTKKMLGDIIVHVGVVKKGTVKVDDVVSMEIDNARRQAIRANHSATHLLHAVLRKKLGEHVTQKGSLVDEDRLRFDFSHTKSLSAEDLQQIEREVNVMIRENSDAVTKLMTPEAAIAAGAMALFGEKYGDEVRVLTMGYSTELCGGTHVSRTGDIGLFKITKETSISAGVRRIEAVTAQAALDIVAANETILNKLAAEFKSPPEEVAKRVDALIEERKKLERELAEAKRKLAMGTGGSGGSCPVPEDVNGVKYLGLELQDISAKDLKPIIDEYKGNIGSGIVAIAASFEGKVSLVVGVTTDLTSKYNAVDLVRVGAEVLGGKGGGGRPDMAQAGGADISKMNAALIAIRARL
jgi:alanyl-tRNA synthetase